MKRANSAESANSEQGFTQSAGDGGCWGTYVEKMKRLEAFVADIREWVESEYPVVRDDEKGPHHPDYIGPNLGIKTCKAQVRAKLNKLEAPS